MHARPLLLTLALLGCRHEPAAPARPPAPTTAHADALWALKRLPFFRKPEPPQTLVTRGHGAG